MHIHGGPGSGSKPQYALYYNPDKYRIVLYAQRGSGKSTPQGELKGNTTQELVEDLEKLKNHLNISNWIVSGASWGTTLALVYAQEYPGSVKALLLRSIFLARKIDTDWIYTSGAEKFFPDYWEPLQKYLKKNNLKNRDLLKHLYQIVTSNNPIGAQKAVALLKNWEANLLKLIPWDVLQKPEKVTQNEINSTKIELHYRVNNHFLEEDQILSNISAIKNIPTTIIHGRYDMICPFEQAWTLHKALPNSKLVKVSRAGHHSSEKTLLEAHIKQAEELANKLIDKNEDHKPLIGVINQ